MSGSSCSACAAVVPLLVGQVTHARGLLLAHRGDTGAAERLLAEAVRATRPIGFPFGLARALRSHGAVLSELGRRDEANKALYEARSIFAQLGATPWLERIEHDEVLA